MLLCSNVPSLAGLKAENKERLKHLFEGRQRLKYRLIILVKTEAGCVAGEL